MDITKLYYYRAVVVRVIDADTVDFLIDLGFTSSRKERLRLARIDAPEVRGPEREAGLEAKAWLQSKLAIGDEVLIRTNKSDSFGRYIAEIFIETDEGLLNLCDELVKVGHAEYREY